MNVVVSLPGRRVPRWHAWCIGALRAAPALSVSVVLGREDPGALPSGLGVRLGGRALAPADVTPDAFDPADGADVVLDLGGGALGLRPREGVWRFRLGEDDDRDLPFAREIAAGRPTFESALIRSRDGRDEVLRKGRFASPRWYPATLRQTLAEAARWPATLASALAAGAELHGEAAPPSVRRTPASRLRFVLSLGRRAAGALTTALLEIDEWNVGFVEGGPARLLAPEPLDVKWLPRPAPRSYIADPFLVERDGVRALFVETFDYRDERGAIEAIVLDEEDRIVRRARVLDLPTHLSYPYPVEIDGELYLMPENSAAGEAALYRCAEFPDRWERETAVLSGIDAVDTTLFAHEGRWWAFCTRYSRGSTLALHAFHAESPRGPWTPHALNPIVVDVTRARPAGQPFSVDGALYRPAQDCSRSYGCALVIARIDELTPSSYREQIVRRLDPSGFARWNAGIHTVSFAPGRIVIDGKRAYRDLRRLRGAARKIAFAGRRAFRRRPVTEATFA
ncbi:MAG TPA: hypothetical protein VK669_12925 [Candidatus Limnocylindrales bacterium]|nr:hypothetical protein [Candidatus Limnocylindrales bacterium]